MAKQKSGQPSMSGYWRKLFDNNPRYLRIRSNAALREQWEKDHPGKKCTASIKSSISNVKTFVRKQLGMPRLRRRRGKRGRRLDGVVQPTGRRLSGSALEKLEVLIDECLNQARQHDDGALGKVIQHLRMARNTVVYKQGKYGD